jgi:beta-glucanase (GH16 family)
VGFGDRVPSLILRSQFSERPPNELAIRLNIANPCTSFRRTWARLYLLSGFVLGVTVLLASSQQHAEQASSGLKPTWVLTWSDEFNGPVGSMPDPAKWVVETGGNGWGNNELEYHTARSQNIRQENGDLVIEAIKEKFTGPDGVRRNYTSARVKTQGRFAQRYGRFEARIKVPSGRGLWSAFWLLGAEFPTAGWPACGEIDIMEQVGSQLSTIHNSMHGPGYSGKDSLVGTFTFPNAHVGDDFHVFAAEWEPEVVRFYVDGELYETRTSADVPSGKPWVFDHPFFVILNLAIGGNLPGNPVAATVFPQRLLVDYVRVYSHR